MATVMHAIVDTVVDPARPEVGAYTAALVRELVLASPAGCTVEGIVSSSAERDYETIEREIPGLARLFKSALARPELIAAWQHGFTSAPRGMIHATSLLAPLRAHDRLHNLGEQTVVTVHDTALWRMPGSLSRREASWQGAMIKRVDRFADAVIVTSHTAGEVLAERTNLGDRVRVVPPAALLGETGQHEGGVVLIEGRDTEDAAPIAARIRDLLDVEVHRQPAGSSPSLAGALLLVHLGEGDAFPYAALDALGRGLPLAIRDTPIAREAVDFAAEFFDEQSPEAIAEAAQRAVGRAGELAVLGQDRARAFTWRSAAEKIWQLHADL